MTEVRFVTREIGSLAKPGWRVKAIAGRPVEERDIEEAQKWGERLGVEPVEELIEILRESEGFTDEEEQKIQDFSALYGIRLLESAGLDVVYDGEQRRSEMYDHAVRHAKGFETRGTVRSWDNKYYTKAAVTEKPLVDTVYDPQPDLAVPLALDEPIEHIVAGTVLSSSAELRGVTVGELEL